MAFNITALKSELTYSSFSKRMLKNIKDSIDEGDPGTLKKEFIKPSEYCAKNTGGQAEICVCPEPINFYSEITQMDRTEEKLRKFEELRENFKTYKITRPEGDFWPNQTSNGINLRIGNKDKDKGDQSPAVLGDECVHGVIVGRTGAGKSVLINNIILNLISEYSPWELDLFLVDMKKVELSRYMAKLPNEENFITPHISACAATSEVRYVVSLIEYLCNCMKARQTLFAALGVQKISDFRERFNLKLSRVLLLVDEFQQLFLEASGKERRILDESITAITKLGRATGFHLLFASQEMSGALGAKELANFKLRIALPCDESISTQILGNNAASKIQKKGITLVNKNGGSGEEDNIMYQTPFVNDKAKNEGEESEFISYLHTVFNLTKADGYTFSKNQKFYQEDVQDKIEVIEKIKKHHDIIKQIKEAKEINSSIIDAFVLGTGVLYTNKEVDYESVFLEKGKRRNIGVLCTKDSDIISVLHTLLSNFVFSQQKCNHYVDYESELLRSGYSEFIDDLNNGKNTNEAYEINFEDIMKKVDGVRQKIKLNSLFIDISEEKIKTDKVGTVRDYIYDCILKVIQGPAFDTVVKKYIEGINDARKISKQKPLDPYSSDLLGEYGENIIKIYLDIYNQTEFKGDSYEELYSELYATWQKTVKSLEDKNSEGENLFMSRILTFLGRIFKKTPEPITFGANIALNVFWILGMDNIDAAADKVLMKMLDTCTLNNMLFVLVGNNIESDRTNNPFKLCNYIFLSSPSDKLYGKFNMSFTKRSDDSKSIDFKIINFNAERSFKLFKTENKSVSAPRLNFDNWR